MSTKIGIGQGGNDGSADASCRGGTRKVVSLMSPTKSSHAAAIHKKNLKETDDDTGDKEGFERGWLEATRPVTIKKQKKNHTGRKMNGLRGGWLVEINHKKSRKAGLLSDGGEFSPGCRGRGTGKGDEGKTTYNRV